jgi:hypothetical protein
LIQILFIKGRAPENAADFAEGMAGINRDRQAMMGAKVRQSTVFGRQNG